MFFEDNSNILQNPFPFRCINPLKCSTLHMKNLIYHFPTYYAYSVKEPIGELNLKRALDEDTGVFSFFFSYTGLFRMLSKKATSYSSQYFLSVGLHV